MTLDPRLPRQIFMHISTVQGPHEQSFEEARVSDYLKAYTATGRPPVPCPPTPVEDQARVALGLPPLFKPYPIPDDTPPYSAASSSQEPPVIQLFRPMTEAGVIYHHLTFQQEFFRFSSEELRCHAYRSGSKFPAAALPPIPPPSPLPQPLMRTDTASMAQSITGQTTAFATDNDIRQSISTSQQFNQHSHEELRVAYLRHGREMTSSEIFALSGPTPISSSSANPFNSSFRQTHNPSMLVSGPSIARLS